MRLKILLLICPLLAITSVTLATTVPDSIGVENHEGKKVILHKVAAKETYYGLGQRYHVAPNLIIQYNNNAVLQPGQTVKVPTELPFADIKTAAPTQTAASKPEVKQTTQQFRVSAGETLYSIAKRFGTTVDEIKTQNNLKSDVLSPGQTLNIKSGGVPAATQEQAKETVAETKVTAPVTQPQTKPQVQQPVSQPQATAQPTQTAQSTTPASTANTQQYKVSNGETLYTIAKRFNTSVDDIVALNKIQNNTISPGQILTVRSGMPPAPAPAVAKPQDIVATRDSTTPSVADSLGEKHLPGNRYGLFEKNEKGAATWLDDPSIDPKKQLVLHRTAPVGTIVRITNPMTNRTTFAKVVGSFTENASNKDAIVVVTKGVADAVGAVDKRFRVNLSYGVPANEQ